MRVHSAAPDRATYLARPDLGRRLAAQDTLKGAAAIVVAIADGLSAIAVQTHAVPLLAELRAISGERWSRVPVVVALQARVALGDEIGARLNARLVVVMIGERPGLSSPDSLGIYVTYAPRVGRTDAERNCLSNIRPQGLSYADAARKLLYLCNEARRRQLTGVELKDDADTLPSRELRGLDAKS